MSVRKSPDSDEQLELFSAVFTDLCMRDSQDTMAAPFLSLSKRPRFEPIRHEDKNRGVEITVSGGRPWGIANIWDWDLIMWLLAQIRHAIDNDQPVSPRIRFHRHAFLKDARRAAGGFQYRQLESSITRLKNTHVRTTIRAANGATEMFNWLERATIQRDLNGRVVYAVVQLPDWLFRAVCDHQLVLSLHRDYFLLTGGIERWLYRFIRKGAGDNRNGWKWRLSTLHKRSGSSQRERDFFRDVRKLIKKRKLLDYELKEIKTVRGEPALRAKRAAAIEPPALTDRLMDVPLTFLLQDVAQLRLKTTTLEKAKRIAPDHDIYALEDDWRRATSANRIAVRNPDAMFLKWCGTVASRQGLKRAT